MAHTAKKSSNKTKKNKYSSACVGLPKDRCIFPCKSVKQRNQKHYGHCRTMFHKNKTYMDVKTKKIIQNKLSEMKTVSKKADILSDTADQAKKHLAKAHKKVAEVTEKASSAENTVKDLGKSVVGLLGQSLGLSSETKPEEKEKEKEETKEEKEEEEKPKEEETKEEETKEVEKPKEEEKPADVEEEKPADVEEAKPADVEDEAKSTLGTFTDSITNMFSSDAKVPPTDGEQSNEVVVGDDSKIGDEDIGKESSIMNVPEESKSNEIIVQKGGKRKKNSRKNKK